MSVYVTLAMKKVYNFVKPVDKVTAHGVAVDPRGEEEGLPKF